MLMGGQSINLRARQLVYVLAAMMDKERPTDTIRVGAKEFLNFVNANNREKWTDIYSLTSEIFDHLNDHPILLRKPKSKEFKKINWLGTLGVVRGHVEARFSPDIADYFLYRQGLPYTKLLWDIRAYQSRFTARILDLFQRHHVKESGRSEVSFEYCVDDLKLFFGVHEQYSRFFDFEKRVLKVTRSELEELDTTPYWFEYEKVKSGRNVAKIRFCVHVRPKVLIEMVPELSRIKSGDAAQFSMFNSGEWELTPEGKKLLAAYRSLQMNEGFALKVLGNLTNSQGRAYYYLVKYGVNRSLAFTLATEDCSFGELVGYEDHYVQFVLDETEKKRIRRIAEVKAGKSKKKTTPDSKKGALPKQIFRDQLYLPEFMDRLSSIRSEHGMIDPQPLITLTTT